MIAVGILIIILLALALCYRKKRQPPDFYAFFVMGVIWLVVGIPLQNYALVIMGFVFASVGILNREKWKQNRRDWSRMDEKERLLVMIIIGILTVLLLLGVAIMFFR